MAIPEFQAFFLPVLRTLSNGEVWSRAEAQDAVANAMGLTSEEREERLPGGGLRLSSRVHWTITYLVQAGAVERVGRGMCRITPDGQRLLAEHPDGFSISVLKQFEGFLEFTKRSSRTKPGTGAEATHDDERDPLDQARQAIADINAALVTDLLQRIIAKPPVFLERLILRLLVAMNFGADEQSAEHLGGPNDEGFDGVIHLDRLGLERVYLQAKRYTDGTVGRPAVQSFVGALTGAGATRGVFITTSRFSAEAIAYARQVPQSIRLIDGEEFARLLMEHRVGVQVTETISVLAVDENFFDPAE